MSALRTEADLLRTLERGTYTVAELYALAERAGLADRPGGRRRIQDGKEQYKRRVRTALQGLRRQGRASRVDDGQPAWLIEGTTDRPRRALFVWLPTDPGRVELVLGKAAQVLDQADEPIDLIVADPPYALARGDDGAAYRRTYARNHGQVVGGYVDVDPGAYPDFTAEWIAAAGRVLRPGGYLAVITGAQQAARVQVIAEDVAGLTYVNSIAVPRWFGMYTTRRFVHGSWRVTLMCAGPLGSARRHFERPEEMPRGEAGEVYATDVWTDIPAGDLPPELTEAAWTGIPEERRPGLLRYDNALPVPLVSRIIRATTRRRELVGDPFVGSGTALVAALEEDRRFYGGDDNAEALRFTMARVLAETVPTLRQGRLL